MQSSSGGDEELESRADTVSAIISHPQNHVSSPSKCPVLHPQTQKHPPHLFDPLSSYLDPIRRSSSSRSDQNLGLHMDMLWYKPLRSDPNHDLGAVMPSPSSSLNTQFFQSQTRGTDLAAFPTTQHSVIPPDTGASASGGLLPVSASTDRTPHNSNDYNNFALNGSTTTNPNMVRNPKKRSRASRRAPTTVLTTDTTNFRAMVQEFTGIPAPPFTSTHFPRSRIDLLGTAAASNLRSAHFDSLPAPPYLLRPSAHKVQLRAHPSISHSSSSSASFPSSSAMVVDSIVSNSSSSTVPSTSVNYPLSSDLGLLKETPDHLLNMNMHTNTMFNFQSFLPTSPKYPLANSSSINLESKPQGSLEITSISAPTDSDLKMRGVLEEYGLSHGHANTNLSGLQNMIYSSSDAALSGSDAINKASITWGNVRGTTHAEGEQTIFRSNLSGTYRISERVMPHEKGKYWVFSSDFHGDKVPDCVAAARSEGMVESWIDCSSDPA